MTTSAAMRLFPFAGPHNYLDDERSVVIDPNISFGRPIVSGSGVTTATLVRRIDAVESVEHLALDYGIPAEKIEGAIMFEKAA